MERSSTYVGISCVVEDSEADSPARHDERHIMMQARRTRLIERVLEYGVLAGTASWSGCVMTRPARTADLAPPSALAVRPVSFPSRSGSTIRAWLLGGSPGVGAVLLLHGVGDNRSSMVGRARFLHRAGYTVLLPDFQAHGESAGARVTFGALESLDAEAALAFLRVCSGGESVGIIGVSMGGAAALLCAGQLPADAYVLESVYPTIRQALENRLGVWLGPLGMLNRFLPLFSCGERETRSVSVRTPFGRSTTSGGLTHRSS